MSGNLQETQSFKGLIKVGKFFKALFWLTVVYIPLSIASHWFYFALRSSSAKNLGFVGGVYSSLTYLVVGAVCACLFYALSEMIKLLVIINAKIKERKNL